MGMHCYAWVCTSVRECVHVCFGAQVCVYSGVCRYTWVCLGMCGCVGDEVSEYILETGVLTSADFNTYPIRIFSILFPLCSEIFLEKLIYTLFQSFYLWKSANELIMKVAKK